MLAEEEELPGLGLEHGEFAWLAVGHRDRPVATSFVTDVGTSERILKVG